MLADIYQMRKVLEPDLAGSLAGTLSPDQLDELQALSQQLLTSGATLGPWGEVEPGRLASSPRDSSGQIRVSN